MLNSIFSFFNLSEILRHNTLMYNFFLQDFLSYLSVMSENLPTFAETAKIRNHKPFGKEYIIALVL